MWEEEQDLALSIPTKARKQEAIFFKLCTLKEVWTDSTINLSKNCNKKITFLTTQSGA